jgi:hypothetical protein
MKAGGKLVIVAKKRMTRDESRRLRPNVAVAKAPVGTLQRLISWGQ